jgi:hypothetical protein
MSSSVHVVCFVKKKAQTSHTQQHSADLFDTIMSNGYLFSFNGKRSFHENEKLLFINIQAKRIINETKTKYASSF